MGPALIVVGQVGSVMERIGYGLVDQAYYQEFDQSGNHVERDCAMTDPDDRLLRALFRAVEVKVYLYDIRKTTSILTHCLNI